MQKMELRYWWEHGNKKKNISGMESVIWYRDG